MHRGALSNLLPSRDQLQLRFSSYPYGPRLQKDRRGLPREQPSSAPLVQLAAPLAARAGRKGYQQPRRPVSSRLAAVSAPIQLAPPGQEADQVCLACRVRLLCTCLLLTGQS